MPPLTSNPTRYSAGEVCSIYTMNGAAIFGSIPAMRTVIILATVAFGAMRLVLRTFAPAQHLELAGEWTADE